MKSLTLIIFALFTFNMTQAQYQDDLQQAASDNATKENKVAENEKAVQWGELTGPEAKNQPVWKYANSQKVATSAVTEHKQGPAAKNSKVWKKNEQAQYIPVVTKPRKDLKGPRFKNRKPGS